MYIDDFYTPSTQLGFEPDFSGYIPDQNMQPHESPYDLQFDQRLEGDLTQQLQNYIQRQKPIETKRKPKDYIVINDGNTLSQLAEDYNTTVEDLARLNGIKDINRIKAGQVLRLNNKVVNKYKDYTYTNRAPKSTKSGITQSKNLNTTANAQQKPSIIVTNTNKNKKQTWKSKVSYKPQIRQYPFKYIKPEAVNNTRANTKTQQTAKNEEPRLMIRFFNWLKKQDDSRKAYLENEKKRSEQNYRKWKNSFRNR